MTDRFYPSNNENKFSCSLWLDAFLFRPWCYDSIKGLGVFISCSFLPFFKAIMTERFFRLQKQEKYLHSFFDFILLSSDNDTIILCSFLSFFLSFSFFFFLFFPLIGFWALNNKKIKIYAVWIFHQLNFYWI